MKRHKIISSKILHESRNFTLETEEVELFGGGRVTRDRVIHHGAAVMIPVLNDGRVVMVKQYRHAVRDELIEFPAGTIDLGEQPIECAKRELIEEIGKSAGELIDLGILYPCPGFCSEIQYLFVARDLADAEIGRDEDELIEILPLSIAEVQLLIKQHKILDGKTIAAFYRATALGYLGS